MAKLESNRYGKFRVRVMKVIRHDAERHDVCEVEADVLLRGDLGGSYLSDDNGSIVPTDTVKNTVHFLAHDHLGVCRTEFVKVIGGHFLEKYGHIDGVEVELRERRWERMRVGGRPHPHAFVEAANGEPFSRGSFVRGGEAALSSGIRGHLMMKTTRSAFTGYHVCELTTLPPAEDRVFATRLTGEWTFSDSEADFGKADEAVLAAVHEVFATRASPSVQRTLYEVGELVLERVPEIVRVELKMPNVHFLGLDLSRFGRAGQNAVFLPTDEPHGEIEAVIVR